MSQGRARPACVGDVSFSTLLPAVIFFLFQSVCCGQVRTHIYIKRVWVLLSIYALESVFVWVILLYLFAPGWMSFSLISFFWEVVCILILPGCFCVWVRVALGGERALKAWLCEFKAEINLEVVFASVFSFHVTCRSFNLSLSVSVSVSMLDVWCVENVIMCKGSFYVKPLGWVTWNSRVMQKQRQNPNTYSDEFSHYSCLCSVFKIADVLHAWCHKSCCAGSFTVLVHIFSTFSKMDQNTCRKNANVE